MEDANNTEHYFEHWFKKSSDSSNYLQIVFITY